MAETKKDQKNNTVNISDDTPICFTIMPFGGWHDNYYSEVFKPAIEDAAMKSFRADDIFRPGTIVKDIWDHTKMAEIILADLSKKNANVMYELGLAHAISKPAILVTESVEDIPFDLRAIRVIVFDKNAPDLGQLLRKKITQAIKEIQENPLKSVPLAFLEVDESQRATEVSPAQLDILEIKQEMDQIKRQLRSSGTRSRSRIRQEEAELLIRAMIDDGMPQTQIQTRLLRLGAPDEWIEDKIINYLPAQEEDEIPF